MYIYVSEASLVAQTVKRLPAMQETQVRFLGREDPLQNEMAIHSSIVAWRATVHGTPRVGHDFETKPFGDILCNLESTSQVI